MYIHKVEHGEDVYKIAAEYGISPERLRELNGISGDRLVVGDRLLVTVPTRTYHVRPGDRIEDIAARFSTTTEAILAANPELHGIPKLYPSQVISVKEGGCEYGMAAANGYLYSGAGSTDLTRALPYLDYLTISSGVICGDEVGFIFDDSYAVNLTRSAGKLPLLRIYAASLPRKDERTKLLEAIKLIAKGRGFCGVTLGGAMSGGVRGEAEEYVLEAKKRFMECDLLLFTEAAADGNTAYTEFSDGCTLTYDKIHLEDAPCFDSGERQAFTGFAEEHDTPRVFVDLSPFAYIDGRYVTKSKARALAVRKGAELMHDDNTLILSTTVGSKKKNTLKLESAENTKAKLELVSELGFMGISFDVGRFEPQDVNMFRAMFGRLPAINERAIY